MNDLPPPLPPSRVQAARPAARGRRLVPLLLILGPLLLATGVHWARDHQLPLPGCGFRRLTGLPCPTCGSTRALDALAQGHWRAALNLNPLLVAASLGSVLGGFWALTGRWRRHSSTAGPRGGFRRWWFWGLLVAVLANWAWLLWRQP